MTKRFAKLSGCTVIAVLELADDAAPGAGHIEVPEGIRCEEGDTVANGQFFATSARYGVAYGIGSYGVVAP